MAAEDYFDHEDGVYWPVYRTFGDRPNVKCNQCGTLCRWADEPGRGWKLFENGRLHVCPSKRAAPPEELD